MRLLNFASEDAATNMAIDEAILRGVQEATSPPTLRLYGWQPPAISLGYFQGLHIEVDTEACQKQGVDIVRRITGGGAVLHEDEVTYSIIAPESWFSSDITEAYRDICGLVIQPLIDLGLPARFAPINDILVDQQKISGNAQTRKRGVLLQHGTILCSVDVDKMFSLLKVDDTKMQDKLVRSVKKRVTSLKDHNITREDFLRAMISHAHTRFDMQEGTLSKEEKTRAERIRASRYKDHRWTAQR